MIILAVTNNISQSTQGTTEGFENTAMPIKTP